MTHTCKRCGHQWTARRPRYIESHADNADMPIELAPVRCPRCQSPYWQRERTVRKVNAKETPDVPQQ